MGIKGLSKYLKELKIGIVNETLHSFSNTRVAVDASIFLYRYKYKVNDDTEYINRFRGQISSFKKYNIEPIYVFDGAPPKEKKETIEKRKANENVVKITKEDTILLKELLEAEDILYYDAPQEAEKLCVYMNKVSFVKAVISNDLDCITLGCNTLITSSGKEFLVYNTNEILEKMGGISQTEFVDICIATGTDYHPGIKGLGIKKSLKKCLAKTPIEEWGIPENLELDNIRNILTNFEELKCDENLQNFLSL